MPRWLAVAALAALGVTLLVAIFVAWNAFRAVRDREHRVLSFEMCVWELVFDEQLPENVSRRTRRVSLRAVGGSRTILVPTAVLT